MGREKGPFEHFPPFPYNGTHMSLKRSVYAFGPDGKRLPNLTKHQAKVVHQNANAKWIRAGQSLRIPAQVDLSQLHVDRCVFCGQREGGIVVWSTPKRRPLHFAAVCQPCFEQYRSLPPAAYDELMREQISFLEDFGLRYPDARMALVSPRPTGLGLVIGYALADDIRQYLDTNMGKICCHSGGGGSYFLLSKGTTKNSVDRGTRAKLMAEADGVCTYCGRTFSEKKLTLDHLLPRRLRGSNHEENLAVACQTCNADKGVMADADYRAYLARKEQLHEH